MDFVLARKRLGLTQAQMADRLGVSQSTVALWERGKTKPKVTSIPKTAEAYGVSAQEIAEHTIAKQQRSPGGDAT